jgi:hypothetical protein
MKMKKVLVQRKDWESYERFPTMAYQRKQKLVRNLTSDQPSRCTVSFGVPDSDMYAVEFKFERQKGKWILVEVEDNSL